MSILRIGSRGSEVAALQSALNSQLRPSPNLTVDQVYGAQTAQAVRRFQAANWLVEDSVAGPCTQTCVFNRENFTPILHRVNLIAQPTDETCWATSTAMMKNSSVSTVILATPADMILPPNPQNALRPPPLNVGGLANSSETDQAIVSGTRYGIVHGLRCFAPMSWMSSGLRTQLNRSPMMWDMLWNASDYTAGMGSSGHMLVVAGMRGNTDDDETITLRVYDPWPPKRGRIYSVGYARWMREVPTRTYRIFTRN